ncbi:class I tRNA ligase family protein [Serratia ficaria]|uniref:class I tRNA ligase family protein n=1 Tax=Serratia ficaria TaxID=61651 RepID=UPI002178DF14|nr:class I tRNA ligase family protein [Serratia ficaria]CAI1057615.1 Methionine--tRNA ligase [Serratia ficaria]CAI2022874.1 Methionine--tRNA ligase [Serratia ficaria]CAI2455048.1 Methionine--tRNA ligase [Serratia ficaria]CAI2532446.1 Methionine--tRNA ligase [Serratia ficaria]CAI2537842.1 Methionine--tRNA ligase [Serratia ficaria]
MKCSEVFNVMSSKNMVGGQWEGGIFRVNPIPEDSAVSIRLINMNPDSSTERHNHTEIEFWTILSGSVRIHMDGSSFILKQGDSIRVEPLQRHRIEALEQGAVMQTVWWHNQEIFDNNLIEREQIDKDAQKPLLIVPAMLTPNGGMHIGHAGGPFMLADVLARISKMNSRETYLVQGTHGHLEHIQIAANAAGVDYYSLAERNTQRLKRSLGILGVNEDIFLETRPCKRGTEIVYEVLSRLMEQGLLVERVHNVPFDTRAGRFCVDAFVHGDCPHCGGESSGTECEGCGALVLDADLKNPVNLAGELLTHKPLKRLFLRLEGMRKEIEAFISNELMPTQAKLYVESWLSRELPEVCLTNPNSAGIPVDIDGLEQLKFTVPMEYVPRHLLAVEKISELKGMQLRWHEVAMEDFPELAILFGVDNSFGRLLVIPAVLAAIGLPGFVPRHVMPNQMMTLNSEKFSTSRNHAIWVDEYVTAENSESIRFYLCKLRANRIAVDFRVEEFENFNANFWYGQLKVCVAMAQALVIKMAKNGELPGPGQWSADCVSFFSHCTWFDEQIRRCYSPIMPNVRFLTRNIISFIDEIQTFIEDVSLIQKPCFVNSALNRTRARLVAKALISLSVAFYPITPKFSKNLIAPLGLDSPSFTLLDVDWMNCELKIVQN